MIDPTMNTMTYCMTSNCPLAADCARYEDDAGRHSLKRTYADFSEELVRRDGTVTCPFHVAKEPPA
jgi:hypothetical protein